MAQPKGVRPGGGWPRGGDGLTVAERETLRVMQEHQAGRGVAMSVANVARALGLKGVGRVHHRVNRLADAGYVERVPEASRTAYVATARPGRAGQVVLTEAEMELIEAAAAAWRAREGRPAPLGEALAGMIEEWMKTTGVQSS